MKAKTFFSTNNWTAPQSLSSFGIHISNDKSLKILGLEEFNFCDKLKQVSFMDFHLAYIPAFSTCSRQPIEKLELFASNMGEVYHYATLQDVVQVNYEDIGEIRTILTNEGFLDFVIENKEFKLEFGDLFEEALCKWKECFNSNNITNKGTEKRFVVNTLYKKIIWNNPFVKVNWNNLKRANNLYT